MKVGVFDTESNGFLDVADKLWCIAVTTNYTDLNKWSPCLLYGPSEIEAGLEYLHTLDVLVGHNIIKHDLPLLEKLYGWVPMTHQVIVDTLVMSRKLYPKRPIPYGFTGKGTHSIEAWGHRLGFPKPDHEDWSQYSEAMGERCKADTEINRLVLEELEREADYLPNYYQQLKLSYCA